MAQRIALTTDGITLTAEFSAGGVSINGDHAFVVSQETDGVMQATSPDGVVRGVAARSGDVIWISIDGRVFAFQAETSGGRARATSHAHEALTPPMSATVVRILVKAGDAVHAGDLLMVLEAMKMEQPIHAPHDGRVTAVNCKEGDLVQPGVTLVDLDHAPAS